MKRLLCGVNVRQWTQFVAGLVIATLISNLLLFNLAVTYKDELLPAPYRRGVSIDEQNTTEIIERDTRVKRRINESNTFPGIKKDGAEKDTGHPVASDGVATTALPLPTTTRPSVVYLTRMSSHATTTSASAITTANDRDILLRTAQPNSAVKKMPSTEEGVLTANLPLSQNENTTWRNETAERFRHWRHIAVFAAPGLGILIGYLPTQFALGRFGTHKTMAASLLISGISSALMSTVLPFGVLYVSLLRFLHGISVAPLFGFIGLHTANWAPLKEQLYFVVIGFVAIQLAPIVSWSASHILLESGQLHIAYAINATCALLLVPLWIAFYRDTPQKHRLVNGIELNKIVAGKFAASRLTKRNVAPFLLHSFSVWSIWLSAFAYFLACSTFFAFLPVYWSILEQPINVYLPAPFLFAALIHLIAYRLNKINCCGTTAQMRIFNGLGFVGCGICFLLLAILPPDDTFSHRSSWLIWFSLAPLGFTSGGFIQNLVLYGRCFSRNILSHFTVPFGLSMCIIPVGVLLVNAENTMRFWRILFLTVAATCILAAAIFAIFARAEPARWAENTWDPSRANSKMLSADLISQNEECGLMEMRTIDEYIGEQKKPQILPYFKDDDGVETAQYIA